MQVNTMIFIWLGLLVLFLAVEFATAQLTTVWFALGALAALLLAAFGVDNLAIQIIVFTLVSLVSLILTRPLVKKWTRKKVQPTNADMVLGEEAVVVASFKQRTLYELVDEPVPTKASVTLYPIDNLLYPVFVLTM